MLKEFVVAIYLIAGMAELAGAATYAERLNNRTVYPIPPPPALGPAGFTFKDPTFGTTIMRLTDELDYPLGMRHVYGAMVSPFNLDSTWIFCGPMNDYGHFIEFDPVNFKRGTRSIDINSQTKTPPGLRPQDGIWSRVDPHIYYSGASDSKLYQFDVSKPELGWVLFKDLTQLLIDAGMPLGSTFGRFTTSWHDDRFALHNDHSGVVWSRSLDKLVWVPPPERRNGSNKGFMDKSGQFYAEAFQGTPPVGMLWKIDTKETWPWPNAGHGDMGTGTLVSLDNSTGSRIVLWELAPNATDRPKEVVFDWSYMPYPGEWGGHSSMESDLEDWTAWEFFTGAHDLTRIYNNEIGMSPTDGSGDVVRLVHHHSWWKESGDYWSQPRIALSQDGKFAAFDSNWGLRLGPDGHTPFTDVFIIDLRDIGRRTPYRAASGPPSPPPPPPCTFALVPSTVNAPLIGGQFQVTITTAQGCQWSASSQADWISTSSSGTGTGVFSIVVSPGNGATRQGTVMAGNQVVTISQLQSPCLYTVSPQQLTISENSATSFIQVYTTPNCAWNATSQSPWITVTGAATGGGQASISISANPTTSPRLGSVSVAGTTVSVQQLGQPAIDQCAVLLYPSSNTVPMTGGRLLLIVRAEPGCAWSASSQADWISANVSGAGTGEFFATVSPGNGVSRQGTVTVGNQISTVSQLGTSCLYTVNPQQLSVSQYLGTSFIQVSTTPGCAWNATSQSSWIATSTYATGTGQASLSISANPTTSPRLGSISVAGVPVSVQQLGQPAAATCVYILTPANGVLSASAGAGSLQLTGSCATPDSSMPWLTGMSFSWPDNPGPQRTTSLTVGGQSFTLTQSSH